MRRTSMPAALTSVTLLALAGDARAFPADERWVEVELAGRSLVDPSGDGTPDLIGEEGASGLAWYADADSVYFRVRFAEPALATDAVVAVMLALDGAAQTLDVMLVSDGVAGEVAAYTGDGATGLLPTWTRVGGDTAPERVQVTPPFLDFSVPRALAEDAGWMPNAAGFAVVASGDAIGSWSDVLGCADLACAPADLRSSALVVDTDSDGLTTPEELFLGLPPTDADADDDGLLDSLESAFDDGDQDGLVDARDCDSDADGLPDGLEAGVVEPTSGTAEGPCFRSDEDPSTTSDGLLADTDQGGLIDGAEDVNRNGRLDAWETDPADPSDDLDTDGDGVADVLEAAAPDGLVDDADSDGDGVSDAAEWLWDFDEDGLPAFIDDDSDGDGFLDSHEGSADTDEDGWIDALDPDSDGDGRLDADEGEADIDCDGVVNRLDADDFDGYCDAPDVDPNFEDEQVIRPEGSLGGCTQLPAPLWLFGFGLLVRRRR